MAQTVLSLAAGGGSDHGAPQPAVCRIGVEALVPDQLERIDRPRIERQAERLQVKPPAKARRDVAPCDQHMVGFGDGQRTVRYLDVIAGCIIRQAANPAENVTPPPVRKIGTIQLLKLQNRKEWYVSSIEPGPTLTGYPMALITILPFTGGPGPRGRCVMHCTRHHEG